MINVVVKLAGFLRKYSNHPIMIQTSGTVPVQQIAIQIGVPVQEIFRYVINGEIVQSDCIVNNGDEISFLPPIAGG